jgi:hypothetical protein
MLFASIRGDDTYLPGYNTLAPDALDDHLTWTPTPLFLLSSLIDSRSRDFRAQTIEGLSADSIGGIDVSSRLDVYFSPNLPASQHT